MIGVVIITYNSADVIGRCLDACRRFPNLQVLVVDNASTDQTVNEAQRRRGVRLIANTENRGFAAAANQGIRALETDFVLLLNPDTELKTSPDLLTANC